MDKQKTEEYKKRLEEERAKLLAEMKAEEPHEDFGSDVDIDEEADEAESFGEKLALRQSHRERVGDINSALKRIEEGKYGTCEKCGAEIEMEVLNISPESRLCTQCKKVLA